MSLVKIAYLDNGLGAGVGWAKNSVVPATLPMLFTVVGGWKEDVEELLTFAATDEGAELTAVVTWVTVSDPGDSPFRKSAEVLAASEVGCCSFDSSDVITGDDELTEVE